MFTAQACARCCLRFAGVRTTVYRLPAPSGRELGDAVAAKLQDKSRGNGCGGHADNGVLLRSQEAASAGQATQQERLEDGGETRRAHQSAENGRELPLETSNGSGCAPRSPAACEPVCRVCLGVLQSIDGPLSPVAPGELESLPEADSVGVRWHPLPKGDLSTVAEHVK